MSRYQVYVIPEALKEIKELPGNLRQRVRQSIRDFADNPHPAHSKPLDFPLLDRQLYRL